MTRRRGESRAARLAALRRQIAKWEAVDIESLRAEAAALEAEIQRALNPVCEDCGRSWERGAIQGPTPARCKKCTTRHWNQKYERRPYSEIKERISPEAKERHRIANRERMRQRRASDPGLREREAARKRSRREASA